MNQDIKLERLWINELITGPTKDDQRIEIRVDWSNDRHQAIKIDSRKPDDVIKGLQELVLELKAEKRYGEI